MKSKTKRKLKGAVKGIIFAALAVAILVPVLVVFVALAELLIKLTGSPHLGGALTMFILIAGMSGFIGYKETK